MPDELSPLPVSVLTRRESEDVLLRLDAEQNRLDTLRFQCLLPVLDEMLTVDPAIAALSVVFDEEDPNATHLDVLLDVRGADGARSGMEPLGNAAYYLEEGPARRLDQLQDVLNGMLTRAPSWGVRGLVRAHLAGKTLEPGSSETLRRAVAGPDYDMWRASAEAAGLDETLPSSSSRPSSRRM